MSDRENVIKAIECCVVNRTRCFDDNDKLCPYFSTKVYMCEIELLRDALALLKEQEEQKQKWLQSIADNQLANAPKHDRNDFMSLDEHMEYQYQLGVYDGLQMAWDILTEGL